MKNEKYSEQMIWRMGQWTVEWHCEDRHMFE